MLTQGLSFAKTPQGDRSRGVTMLQASPHVIHFKSILDFGERQGKKRVSKEIRDLVFPMTAENPSWGAPRIHGELLMLGLDVSERTVSRWVKRVPEGLGLHPAVACFS